jgi:ATP-dependent DNA helicase RecQ
MARLCVAPGCRTKALLAEFGETSAACGNCDHCRGVFAAPRRAKAFSMGLQAAALSWMTGLWDNAGEAEEGESSGVASPALEEALSPAPAATPPLTVAQERLLREFFKARLALARARRLAPQRIVRDDALTRLACGDSSETALEGVAPRDAQVFLALLAQSRRD